MDKTYDFKENMEVGGRELTVYFENETLQTTDEPCAYCHEVKPCTKNIVKVVAIEAEDGTNLTTNKKVVAACEALIEPDAISNKAVCGDQACHDALNQCVFLMEERLAGLHE